MTMAVAGTSGIIHLIIARAARNTSATPAAPSTTVWHATIPFHASTAWKTYGAMLKVATKARSARNAQRKRHSGCPAVGRLSAKVAATRVAIVPAVAIPTRVAIGKQVIEWRYSFDLSCVSSFPPLASMCNELYPKYTRVCTKTVDGSSHQQEGPLVSIE